MLDVLVVGAGPAGLRSAALLAKAGFEVRVLEEHPDIGRPVQCAGLVTPRVLDISGRGDFVLSEVSGARFASPSGRTLDIDDGKTEALVLDRAAFDRHLAGQASDAGAEIETGSRVVDLMLGAGLASASVRKSGHSSEVEARLVVGADGFRGMVPKMAGLPRPEMMISGFGVELSGISVGHGKVEIFSGSEVAPGFFAWAIPAGQAVRVGLATTGGNPRARLEELVRRRFGISVGEAEPSEVVGGVIPLGLVERTAADRVMLVGDAAGQVKATSGGGIYMGLRCAGHLAKVAAEALEEDNLSAARLSAYHDAWMADVGGELRKCMRLYKLYSGLSDRELDEIFDLLDKPEIIEVIQRAGDIDYPSNVAWQVFKKAPGLVKYAGKAMRAMF